MPNPKLFADAKQAGLVLPPYVVHEMPAARSPGGKQGAGQRQGRHGGHQKRDRDRTGHREEEPRTRPAQYSKGEDALIKKTDQIGKVISCWNNRVRVQLDAAVQEFDLNEVEPLD
jgi:hypothetical protein